MPVLIVNFFTFLCVFFSFSLDCQVLSFPPHPKGSLCERQKCYHKHNVQIPTKWWNKCSLHFDLISPCPLLSCATFTSCWWKQAQPFRWIWRNGALRLCELSLPIYQLRTEYISGNYHFHVSHFPPATCRWEAGMEKSDCRTCSGYGICRDAGQTQKNSIADSCF